MSLKVNNPEAVDMRLVNLTNLELSMNHQLDLGICDVQTAVNEIRKYADLPMGILYTVDRSEFVTELLEELKKIRSACFPYALFCVGAAEPNSIELKSVSEGVDNILIQTGEMRNAQHIIADYAQNKFSFDSSRLKISSGNHLPEQVDVVVVGAGVTGLYAADQLSKNGISFCVVDQRDIIGGIWSEYANTTSQVNTSEGGYRLIEKAIRSNRDHSPTREILEDIVRLGRGVSESIYLNSRVDWIEKADDAYQLNISNGKGKTYIKSKGILLAINDRVGKPRPIEWPNQSQFKGDILTGISDDAKDFDWKGKNVVIAGMGAFAVENTRTALEGGARHVTVVCRRHGTVCPKIIDYLNFTTPYDEHFLHDKKSNMRNMLLWKKLYDLSGATQPECWPTRVKHEGHTISVSDIWFIGHYLKKIETMAGNITGMDENGVIVDNRHHIDADIVLNCIGFYRNAANVKSICDYTTMYNNNYVDKDFMYLADAYIDDDAFNSFFGSSVLEMAKFYLEVYIRFFGTEDFFSMIETDGIDAISIEDRKWSHYISGAAALIKNYAGIYDKARKQVAKRTQNFLEAHDLETYIAANRREWVDTHSLLAGKALKSEDCLPYVFQKLIDKRL